MPNWCSNSVEVSGPSRVVAAWVSNVNSARNSDVGIFGTFVSPEYAEDDVNWYDAHCVAWGTKWDIPWPQLDMMYVDDVVRLNFQTAWSPPVTWLVSMSKDWPSLTFNIYFVEEGMCFMGYMIVRDGDSWIAENETVEWEYSEDEKKQLELNEAYMEAMEKRREDLIWEASDAYSKAMYE